MKSLYSLTMSGLVALALGGVTVRKTGQPPTGYEVDFTYYDKTAARVLIGGGLNPFTDEFHTSSQHLANFAPEYYQPGDFYGDQPRKRQTAPPNPWPYTMVNNGSGVWVFKSPFPSGTYNYAFLPDCDNIYNCSVESGHHIVDPENLPFRNTAADQDASSFQVPYDAKFQRYASMDLNFDYALPAPASHQGKVFTVNYTSPGSSHPANDVHDFTIYLPPGYVNGSGKAYPLLYLSHGGGGNGGDWQNLARASNILDNLIYEGALEPTVVVMPSFYNLNASRPFFYYGNSSAPGPQVSLSEVRENYMKHLFPYVERHFDVAKDPSRRAFAGLSMGGILTYEMFINATDYFGYYGLFSGVTGPGGGLARMSTTTSLAARPEFATKGLFLAYGVFDIAFDDVRQMQAALDSAGIRYISRAVPWGFHYWNTWQDCLRNFGQRALWKKIPFDETTGRIHSQRTE